MRFLASTITTVPPQSLTLRLPELSSVHTLALRLILALAEQDHL